MHQRESFIGPMHWFLSVRCGISLHPTHNDQFLFNGQLTDMELIQVKLRKNILGLLQTVLYTPGRPSSYSNNHYQHSRIHKSLSNSQRTSQFTITWQHHFP